ncbi:60S acidic ribosomal protein P1-like isoform X1 [Papaver somniferum]|uniref:60S acidic ribosomal protein P1-like n=1 Tax=Papaver somniferum TaxID=3469 RepID=UPI000E6F4AC3|nr:60S acidic ribosomal protein P1-like isoform X1 [Papaver somniferum]XP_026438955.1 60S acidic ribosomal protein P1-like isoform X1 [Papaver somniferum]XP_026438958.1 60S acidic ribosomal protein P1-like isoform X1 [Papaver somniferum]XP_026438963.1 60S acidic ribosomal protein P1-like [Papaver somniferum]XP_026438964.1 60S acidic ribosomal protein P1-like isoform X1 [Papaver somniferum]
MSSNGEVACTYAALILHDDGIPITAEKILTLVKKANVQCESYWPSLFAKFVERKNVEDLITNVGATGGAAVAVSASTGGATAVEAPAAEEKKKKEEKEESDDEDMDLFSIFD